MSGWCALRRRLKALMMRRMPGMMTCAELEGWLLKYHEGTLDASARRRVERHLRLCPPCATSRANYARAIALGRRLMADEEQRTVAALSTERVAAILASRRRR